MWELTKPCNSLQENHICIVVAKNKSSIDEKRHTSSTFHLLKMHRMYIYSICNVVKYKNWQVRKKYPEHDASNIPNLNFGESYLQENISVPLLLGSFISIYAKISKKSYSGSIKCEFFGTFCARPKWAIPLLKTNHTDSFEFTSLWTVINIFQTQK